MAKIRREHKKDKKGAGRMIKIKKGAGRQDPPSLRDAHICEADHDFIAPT